MKVSSVFTKSTLLWGVVTMDETEETWKIHENTRKYVDSTGNVEKRLVSNMFPVAVVAAIQEASTTRKTIQKLVAQSMKKNTGFHNNHGFGQKDHSWLTMWF